LHYTIYKCIVFTFPYCIYTSEYVVLTLLYCVCFVYVHIVHVTENVYNKVISITVEIYKTWTTVI